MNTLIVSAAVAAALLATPLAAGQPDSPGAHGQHISKLTKEFNDGGRNLRQTLKFIRTDVADFSPGATVQGVKQRNGGAPNPAKDNGGGNDRLSGRTKTSSPG